MASLGPNGNCRTKHWPPARRKNSGQTVENEGSAARPLTASAIATKPCRRPGASFARGAASPSLGKTILRDLGCTMWIMGIDELWIQLPCLLQEVYGR